MSSSYRTSVLALLLACAAGLQLGKQSLLSQELSDGLVSHWPLDEVQGTRTPDLVSGYDMDLVNLTAEDLVEGQIGMAFSFDNARQTILLRISEEGICCPSTSIRHSPSPCGRTSRASARTICASSRRAPPRTAIPLFNIGTRNNGTTGQVDLYIRNGLSGWPTVGHIFSEQEPFRRHLEPHRLHAAGGRQPLPVRGRGSRHSRDRAPSRGGRLEPQHHDHRGGSGAPATRTG